MVLKTILGLLFSFFSQIVFYLYNFDSTLPIYLLQGLFLISYGVLEKNIFKRCWCLFFNWVEKTGIIQLNKLEFYLLTQGNSLQTLSETVLKVLEISKYRKFVFTLALLSSFEKAVNRFLKHLWLNISQGRILLCLVLEEHISISCLFTYFNVLLLFLFTTGIAFLLL